LPAALNEYKSFGDTIPSALMSWSPLAMPSLISVAGMDKYEFKNIKGRFGRPQKYIILSYDRRIGTNLLHEQLAGGS
jgi:hypothetical protein